MSQLNDMKRTFSNHRQWRDFIAAVHETVAYPCAVTYPNIIGSLRRMSVAGYVNIRCSDSRAKIPPA
jgi:hypothetical protein